MRSLLNLNFSRSTTIEQAAGLTFRGQRVQSYFETRSSKRGKQQLGWGGLLHLYFFYVGQGRRTYRVFHKWFRRKSNQKLLEKKESNYFQVPSSRQRLCLEAEQCYPVRQHHLRLSGEQCVHECENRGGVSTCVRHSHRTLSGIVGLSGMALIVIVWLVYCKDPYG